MSPASASKTDAEKKKKKSKSKDKSFKSLEFVDDADDDLDVAGPSTLAVTGYTPPEGIALYTQYIDSPEFDYDELKGNDDLELWIIKAPDDIKPKHLSNLRVSIPSSSNSSHIGTLHRKSINYDIWSVKEKSQAHAPQMALAGGDDLHGLTCLVPRKKKGNLVIAPKSFEHHIVITGHAALPTPPSSSPGAPEPSLLQDPKRYQHPAHLLKHRFQPIGSLIGTRPRTEAELNDVQMAVDGKDVMSVSSPSKSPRKSRGAKEDAKAKKRKDAGDVESPKKMKKAKTGS